MNEDQPMPERQHVSWEARQLVADHAELARMSDADKLRYCGHGGL